MHLKKLNKMIQKNVKLQLQISGKVNSRTDDCLVNFTN